MNGTIKLRWNHYLETVHIGFSKDGSSLRMTKHRRDILFGQLLDP